MVFRVREKDILLVAYIYLHVCFILHYTKKFKFFFITFKSQSIHEFESLAYLLRT